MNIKVAVSTKDKGVHFEGMMDSKLQPISQQSPLGAMEAYSLTCTEKK